MFRGMRIAACGLAITVIAGIAACGSSGNAQQGSGGQGFFDDVLPELVSLVTETVFH